MTMKVTYIEFARRNLLQNYMNLGGRRKAEAWLRSESTQESALEVAEPVQGLPEAASCCQRLPEAAKTANPRQWSFTMKSQELGEESIGAKP
jgi:hypothetical protein